MNNNTNEYINEINDRDPSQLGTKLEPPYFYGAFNSFQTTTNNPFASEGWISHCHEMINNWNRQISFETPSHLNLIVEHIKKLLQTKYSLSVLDIGGGFGDNFFYIEKALGSLCKRINYLVVDNQTQCDFGINYYKDKNSNISFATELANFNFDISIIIGTIQYIENWKHTIIEIAEITTGSIFIGRTPINIEAPTFVTVQSICPAFGSQALTKIGESNLFVINDSELNLTLNRSGFLVKKSIFAEDYSANFRRLPVNLQKIHYINKHYIKHN